MRRNLIVSLFIFLEVGRLGRTHGIGMKAIAQNPMTEFPHAIPRSLNMGSTAIGIPAPKSALTKSLDAKAEAAYFGYATDQLLLILVVNGLPSGKYVKKGKKLLSAPGRIWRNGREGPTSNRWHLSISYQLERGISNEPLQLTRRTRTLLLGIVVLHTSLAEVVFREGICLWS